MDRFGKFDGEYRCLLENLLGSVLFDCECWCFMDRVSIMDVGVYERMLI